MSTLTPEQEQAMAVFKGNLHLPDGGFHRLILDLCIEFQLPFQTVRAVLKKSQVAIEKKIRHEFENVSEETLTKKNWINIIKLSLATMAKNNLPVMDCLTNNPYYIKAQNAAEHPFLNETDRETLLANLSQAYEMEVFKPLSEMLYTSDLYWHLSDDLVEMTEERRCLFHQYTQHQEAMTHLSKLYQDAESRALGQNEKRS